MPLARLMVDFQLSSILIKSSLTDRLDYGLNKMKRSDHSKFCADQLAEKNTQGICRKKPGKISH
jgi:hypothetical protein